MRLLAIDAGGTRVKAGVVSSGKLIRFETIELDGTPLLEVVERVGRDMLGPGEAWDSVGLSMPGLVDEDGRLVSLPGKHEGLEGTDLRAELMEAFATDRVIVVNDAVAYSMGEATEGAGRGARRSVVITIGTGVGVSVVEDGAPVTGGIFGAGILGGFIPIAGDDGPRDTSGQRGTIEARCAADSLLEYCDGAYGSISAVYEAHARGDRAAITGVDRYRFYLERALIALAHAHAPERLILGGGPMRPGNPLVPGIEGPVNERLFGTYRVSIHLAELGDSAALIGLASLSGALR
ncbi:MAG: ROK family protein [Actinomycetota bacterium]